jgi:hypothetical protein
VYKYLSLSDCAAFHAGWLSSFSESYAPARSDTPKRYALSRTSDLIIQFVDVRFISERAAGRRVAATVSGFVCVSFLRKLA